MAKNIGLIKISGKVGDLQFFQKDGKTYVGLKSEVSKDRILKDPAFKRTRENMAEFGGSAKVSKTIREALIPLKTLIEKQLHSRLTSVLRQLISLGSGVRGKRAIEFSTNQEVFEKFELNKNTKVGEVFYAPIAMGTNTERNQIALTIAEFLPADYLVIPEGATHFRVHTAAMALSDFAPNAFGKYLSLSNQQGLFAKTETAALPVDEVVTGGINLVVDLPGAPTLETNVSLVGIIGIEFLQEVNGVMYLLASNNAVRIEKLF